MTSFAASNVPFTRLSSHSDSVTCLDVPSSSFQPHLSPNFLLSGSDDGTVRLWDVRGGGGSTGMKMGGSVIRCGRCSGSVTAVKFGENVRAGGEGKNNSASSPSTSLSMSSSPRPPPPPSSSSSSSSSSSLSLSPLSLSTGSDVCAVYCTTAAGDLIKYDFRYAATECDATPLVLRTPTWCIHNLAGEGGDDEINSIDVWHGKCAGEGRERWSDKCIAVGDDRGFVTTVDLSCGSRSTTVFKGARGNGHEDTSIIMGVGFRQPDGKNKGGDLVSGGTGT